MDFRTALSGQGCTRKTQPKLNEKTEKKKKDNAKSYEPDLPGLEGVVCDMGRG